MKNVVIDFESFYDKEISVVTQGVPNYVQATDAYCVSVVDTETGAASCGSIKEMGPMIEQMVKDPTVRPVAANSNFDQAWAEKYWPAFQHSWYCVLDHGVFCQYPRNLANLAGVVLGEKVDKGLRDDMMGKHYDDLPEADQKALLDYCLNDSIKEAEILEKLPPMSAFEQKVAEHTRMINRRGVLINSDLIAEDKTKLEQMRFDALHAIPWHADAPPLSYPALVRYCNVKNLPVPKSLAKTDEDTTDLIATCDELKDVISSMRRFRRANTMIKKVETLRTRMTPENILPLDILYCGAPHTRRWSSKGFNVQNLDKEPLIISEGVSVWTRNWIIPRPGKIFYIPDLAQIEPRCLNWLVQNEEMMEALRHGFSYYEAYLTGINGAQRVGWSGTPDTLKKELPVAKYTLVKNESLGCGYGMGAERFQGYVKENGGGDISTEAAKTAIANFRAGNQKVVKFWGKLDNLIRTAAREKSHTLSVEMPTGDFLKHWHVKSYGGRYQSYTTKNDFSHNSHQPSLWGGVLTENVTQRMARDVLANAIINLELAGFPVIFSVHDEVIIEVDNVESVKKEAKIEIDRIMTTAPEWAPDLPLGVDGDFEMCYTK